MAPNKVFLHIEKYVFSKEYRSGHRRKQQQRRRKKRVLFCSEETRAGNCALFLFCGGLSSSGEYWEFVFRFGATRTRSLALAVDRCDCSRRFSFRTRVCVCISSWPSIVYSAYCCLSISRQDDVLMLWQEDSSIFLGSGLLHASLRG